MLSLEPSFAVFRNAAVACAGPLRGVSLNADFSLDPDATLPRSSASSPSSSGWCIRTTHRQQRHSDEQIEAVVRGAGSRDYRRGVRTVCRAQLVERGSTISPNLLVMRTLSKIGLAGVRRAICSAPEMDQRDRQGARAVQRGCAATGRGDRDA